MTLHEPARAGRKEGPRGAAAPAMKSTWSSLVRAVRRLVGPGLTIDPEDAVSPALRQYPYGSTN